MAVTARPPGKRRLAWRWWVAGGTLGLCAVLVAAVLFLRLSAAKAGLTGLLVNGTPQAPDFSLIDETGKTVSLHDYRGKTVALTFLYTNCPDICPIIASTLATADRRLSGQQQGQVQMLAVSVDPLGDTPPKIQKFEDERGLAGLPNWHYLIGSPAQLAKVWQDYGGIEDPSSASAGGAARDQLEHQAIIYLIDPQGRMRVALPGNFTASDFMQDFQALS